MPYDDHDGSLSDWLGRIGISWPGRRDPLWSRLLAARAAGSFPTRGLRRFLDVLRPIEHPALIDLGPASGQTVGFLGQELACRLDVVDLFASLDVATREEPGSSRGELITAALNQTPGSVHGVLCWDVCDYLDQFEVGCLATALGRVLAPGGAAFVMFSTVSYDAAEFTRFGVESVDRLAYRPVPSALVQRRVWLSRDVARLFGGLRVDETYLLSHGLREVIVRRPRTGS